MANKVSKNRTKDEKVKKTKPETKNKSKSQKSKTGLLVALQQFEKAIHNLFGLPTILWPFVLLVSYQIIRNALEKKRQARDLAEAQRFLRESRGFR